MQVQHDSFARGSYTRICYPNNKEYHCRFCGQQPKRLYSYQWEYDDKLFKQVFNIPVRFCNFKCYKAYYC